ncbi:hypothetical protein [Nocardia higoensis]|uniref:hypothetical protein n=1 Tax=Nocardia higoensis TaxID=228599 RepID=UPI0002D654C0|nr:hypothetical protein [Nocardia higoensis]
MATGSASGGGTAAERADDDYDLLTYGEAAARLAETLREERRGLAELEAANADPEVLEKARRRIEVLSAGDARYRRQSISGAAFARRFGFRPSATDDRRPGIDRD